MNNVNEINYKENYKLKSYRFLPYIVSIYSFFFMLPSILLRKMVLLPHFGIIPISILFTGIYFMMLDVVTEVYGYYEARRMLFAGLITYSIFIFIMEAMTVTPSPESYHVAWSVVQDPYAYTYLFHGVYIVWFSVMVCALIANTFNIIILSKWKILIKGKYFWMRSVTTSLVTAIVYSTISNFFAFGLSLHIGQFGYFVKLVLISVSAKLLTLLLCAYPATLFCSFLKKKEGVDVYDYNVNYNPLCFQSLEK